MVNYEMITIILAIYVAIAMFLFIGFLVFGEIFLEDEERRSVSLLRMAWDVLLWPRLIYQFLT